jgi:hypothetical protein
MLDELTPVYATTAVIVLYFLAQLVTGKFDPFAPAWLFLVGYGQVYVVQAISYHDWAISARGMGLVEAANLRALWALLWFLAVYHFGPGRLVAPVLPRPPLGWPLKFVSFLSPILIAWGLVCAGIMLRGGAGDDSMSAEESLFRSFPFVMMVAGVLLIVSGRASATPRPIFLAAGLTVSILYVLIWMFNGKRSHALIGVLATVCALYISRMKRPSWPVLIATLFTGALVVAIAIGWRNSPDYERSASGFLSFVGEFKLASILENANISEGDDDGGGLKSHETDEYGGFLLMMDTVPEKSAYDYGTNYLRVFSTFIPRIVWPSKPIYGRSQWIDAWIAGSERERDSDFTGPAIGILGATQLNGGAVGTLIVIGVAATFWRAAYEYFRRHEGVPWVQFWWAIFSFNAWFMVVNDDPLIWFYYNWGFTTFPVVFVIWWAAKWDAPAQGHPQPAPGTLATG